MCCALSGNTSSQWNLCSTPHFEDKSSTFKRDDHTKIGANFSENSGPVNSNCTWCTGTSGLYWIENRKEWKQFVQHKVNEILTQTSKDQWKHVPGKENPADLGTRGADPSQLKNSKLWSFGPAWLRKDEKEWPVKFQIEETPESMIEAKQVSMFWSYHRKK